MGTICNMDKTEPKFEYVSEGSIIILNFRTEDATWAKPISIHEGNVLLKGIQMFKDSIGMSARKVKKAIYEVDNRQLNLRTKINILNIDNSHNIIVYFDDE